MNEGMYEKYRVIKTADLDDVTSIDVREMIMESTIDTFVFVLRPDRDYHARVALAAYAESVRGYNEALADDITDALSVMDPPTKMEPD